MTVSAAWDASDEESEPSSAQADRPSRSHNATNNTAHRNSSGRTGGVLGFMCARLGFVWEIGDAAATDEAFSKATKVATIDLVNNRLVANAIEPRAAIGDYDSGKDEYTLYTTSQNPHVIRLLMGAFVMGLPEHKLRVIAPDVGGGFGSKIFHYAEEVIVTWA